MRPSRTLLLAVATVLGANITPAQAPASLVTELDVPNPADFEMLAEEIPPPFAQMPNAVPKPPVPDSRQKRALELSAEAQQYRSLMKSLEKNKHQFIHCQLKNGKVLTGLVRGDTDQGFTLHTGAFGGPFVRYEDLADAPKSVPAVGTRIKQGAQWTGAVLGIAVAIPLAIPLCLILYPLIAAGVIQD
ncbi:MAG TPA: hypothetical protein VFP96_04440 [Candidatus Acidoferrum sp.]|nr:hypothetical protein [Candidatus Acidoferrum sp.]